VPEQTAILFGKEQQINHCQHQATEIKHGKNDIDGWPFHCQQEWLVLRKEARLLRFGKCGAFVAFLTLHEEQIIGGRYQMEHLPYKHDQHVRVAILSSLSFSWSRAWGCYQFQVGAGFSPLPMCGTNGVPVFPVLSRLIIHRNNCSLHSRLQKSHVRTHEKALPGLMFHFAKS
jgi:hypothetical protein